MGTVRVLVVEDSLTVRRRLVEVLSADPQMEVVGEAGDGKTGIELCQKLRPDIVTLDMMLPTMSGLEATEYIMAYCPTPILIVSSSTNRGELFKTYDALAAGALDVLEKPNGHDNGVWEQIFISRVKLISHVKVITHLRARLPNRPPNRLSTAPLPNPVVSEKVEPGVHRLVAIGASTGGPAACLQILQSLPPCYPFPILLVIHIGQAFSTFFVEWLESQSPLPVAYATDGELLPPIGQARVLLAPPDRHLVVCNGRMRLTSDPERHSCRPSIDVLFESLAQEIGKQTIACLLTGMGKDGATGLLSIRQAGGRTLAQDQATSIVFGMPQEAIRLGAAERTLGLQEFAPALLALADNSQWRKA
ncbi:MAG TPA: chemotaxis-specific protein-glutamate methyltransferase CheB [Candidatus Sulfotelmatobacter sp.]|jgi:two-component system chemotaxis response regulator CheB